MLKPRGKYCSNHHEKDEFMNRLKISAFWFFLAVFQVIPVHGQTVEWKTFAGNYGAKGVKDGPAAQSRFYEPGGMAPDGSGGIYVADIESDTIRRISSNGVVSTFVGSPGNNGSTDGPVEVARLNRPFMLCNTGTVLLLVDQTVSLNYGRLRQVAYDGTVTTLTDVPEGISGIAARPDGMAAPVDIHFGRKPVHPPASGVRGAARGMFDVMRDREGGELDRPSWTQPPVQPSSGSSSAASSARPSAADGRT